MHFTVTTWQEFRDAWDGVHNFLMTGQCVPFGFDAPPLDRLVAELRDDPEARITSGDKGRSLMRDDIAASFRQVSVDRALESPFSLAHFRLSKFDAPGRCLNGFKQHVLDPWQAALTEQGFTFDRCYPIIFISGPGCATNYHMDFSHVLAWQVYGTKRFCGLKCPGRWAPFRTRVTYEPYALERPDGLSDADALCYDMRPGDVLWNALLTPHWVEASTGAAMSVNLSHGGLRLNGRLCPFEQEREDYIAAHPHAASRKSQGGY